MGLEDRDGWNLVRPPVGRKRAELQGLQLLVAGVGAEAAGTSGCSLSLAVGARQSSLTPQSLPGVQCRADPYTWVPSELLGLCLGFESSDA